MGVREFGRYAVGPPPPLFFGGVAQDRVEDVRETLDERRPNAKEFSVGSVNTAPESRRKVMPCLFIADNAAAHESTVQFLGLLKVEDMPDGTVPGGYDISACNRCQ